MARREPRFEAGLEAAGEKHAKGIGWVSRKLNGEGYRSWPDRMYLGPRCAVFFIEYKRDGEVPTPLQLLMHAILRAAGFRVYVIDKVADARSTIDAETKRAGGRAALAAFCRAVAAERARAAAMLENA